MSLLQANLPNWKNSVRHNLSLRPCFIKVPRYTSLGKKLAAHWEVDINSLPTAAEQLLRAVIAGELMLIPDSQRINPTWTKDLELEDDYQSSGGDSEVLATSVAGTFAKPMHQRYPVVVNMGGNNNKNNNGQDNEDDEDDDGPPQPTPLDARDLYPVRPVMHVPWTPMPVYHPPQPINAMTWLALAAAHAASQNSIPPQSK